MAAPNQFRNLVFEGGGVCGIAYAGALRIIEQRGMLPDIRRVGGASAGAITAALLAMGAEAKGIESIVSGTTFSTFMDPRAWWPGWPTWPACIARTLRRFGWFAGDAFCDWLAACAHDLGHPRGLTFAQLRDRARADPTRFRELAIVASDLTRGLVRQYDADETPTVRVCDAVRASMSIPLFFASVHDAGPPHGVLVDGGVTWNYPIDLFDDRRYLSDPADTRLFEDPRAAFKYPTVYDDTQVYNRETLGFRVDTRDEIREYKDRRAAPPTPIRNVKQYAFAIVAFMRAIANRSHLHANDWCRTVFLDDGGVPFTDFDLTPAQIAQLLRNGQAGCADYFKWFDGAGSNGSPWPINKVRPRDTAAPAPAASPAAAISGNGNAQR